jgi:hypothetical protein
MITFDGEFSVLLHFEVDEQKALDAGGVNIETTKKNCAQLSDWILSAVLDIIELGDNDTCTVLPVELKLMKDDEEIVIDQTAEQYDVKLNDGTYSEAKEEDKK